MEDSNDNEFIERFNIEENDFKDFISNKLPEEINLKYKTFFGEDVYIFSNDPKTFTS